MMQAGDDGALISNCLWESIDTNLEIARQVIFNLRRSNLQLH